MTYKKPPKHFIQTLTGIRSHAIELAVQVAQVIGPLKTDAFWQLVDTILEKLLEFDDDARDAADDSG